MYLRTKLSTKEILKLQVKKQLTLKHCLSKFEVIILGKVEVAENGNLVCPAEMKVKMRRIKKKFGIWKFTWTMQVWEKTNIPENPLITLIFYPRHSKVKILRAAA